MNRLFSVTSSLPSEEFHRVASKHQSEIETAQMSLVDAYKKLTNESGDHLEQCDCTIRSTLALRKTIRDFASMLDIVVCLPCSICALRYPLIKILHCIDQQMSDTMLLLLVLKDIFRRASEQTIIQQRKIQRKLEMLLQDGGDSIANLGILLEQACSLENRERASR
jgi:hypothetical protein